MTRTKILIPLAAVAALAACGPNDSQTIVTGPGADEPERNEAALQNVQLPPAIAASKTYRCGDNSLIYIDWLSDKKSANFRAEPSATPVQLTTAEEGGTLTADGYSLEGTAEAPSVKFERPGKGSQTCKA